MDTFDLEQRRRDPEEVIEALVMVSRVMVALAIRTLAQIDSGLTLQQFRTLVVLVPAPQRVTDLGHLLGLQSSATTRMCDRLVRRGLAVRQERAEDRRVVWVELTPRGRELVECGMRQRRDEIAQLLGDIVIDRPAVVIEFLEAFAARAGELPNHTWWQLLHQQAAKD